MNEATIANTGTAVEAEISLPAVRAAVDGILLDFLDEKAATGDPALLPVIGILHGLVVAGGKRLRPLLCYCGWHAAGRPGPNRPVLRVAAALELFHMFALIHDDVIDSSDTRRGQPTVHRMLAVRPQHRDRPGTDRFAANGAILVGDLALVWSDELLHASGVSVGTLGALRPVLDAMRTELMLGQYLDLLHTRDLTADVEATLTVVRYKSGLYTIERPLQLGALLAGAGPDLLEACARFAVPVGEAFQLRDDMLGAFGDPATTGKSSVDDLRDGKVTTLVALALRDADESQRATLLRWLGDPEVDQAGAAEFRDLLVATGAAGTVEAMIRERHEQALAALAEAPFRPPARHALRRLAGQAIERAS